MLSNKTIDQVRELDIEQVIGRYVTLKPAGSRKKCCCPLHGEKTPSFVVTPAKQIFKCYGCGVGGDAIEFVMAHDNLPFIDAVKSIAAQHGIEIIETEKETKTPEQRADEVVMRELISIAQKKYREALVESPSQVKYLLSRLTRGSIIEWNFGLVPDWQSITPDIINAGKFALGELAGLVKSTNGKAYDYMHHRITIPIHDTRGRQIGFAGRIISGADGPKYMNPPQSPLYEKSKVLFGLHKAIKHFKKHGMAVLVEGYMDVIKLHEKSWNNAVASCGTALTTDQAKLLKRFTDTVLILRDGDNAGREAIRKDIPILLEQQFNVLVVELSSMDPDNLFDKPFEFIVNVMMNYQDGVDYLTGLWFKETLGQPGPMAEAIERSIRLVSTITNTLRRDAHIKSISKANKLKETDLVKQLTRELQRQADQREAERQTQADDHEELFPIWVDRKRLELDGFVQLATDQKNYKAGIYFIHPKNRNLYRVTNFIINPLYHIYESSFNRRMIEIEMPGKNSVVELPTQAFVNQGSFETEILNKGPFLCEELLTRSEFKRITGWLLKNMPPAFELKTLGWQPEGFFAFSNAVFHDGNLIHYDDLGMIKVDNTNYLSLGNSRIHKDERQIDNPYENDLYLKYVEPRASMTFELWAELFNTSFDIHAPYGIGFVFVTLFKDLVIQAGIKIPHLYCFGQKGSGKSGMAENIVWLFFSGKDAEKSLIKGFNLNPGQSTQYSFFNRIERFRNAPVLMNEYDENTNETWKSGAFKAAYDGEGREVGDGETGKRRKTKIQKVQGTIILVGQYLAMKDDAAVSSRSVLCNFSLERIKNLTNDQVAAFKTLENEAKEGLSYLITDLLKYRPEVQKRLPKMFSTVQLQIMEQMRSEGKRIEARLISNYSLWLALTKVMIDLGIKLPYTYESFYKSAVDRMVKHNQTLKDTSILGQFWKSVESMFDKGLIITGTHFSLEHFPKGVTVKEGSSLVKKDVPGEVLLMRYDNVYDEFAKFFRERVGTPPQNRETILNYLKEQTYFIGLVPTVTFNDKRTSAYAFNYEAMKDLDIVLEKNHSQAQPTPVTSPAEPSNSTSDDLPF